MSRSVLVLLWRTAELLAVDCAAGQSRLVGHVACAGRDARSAAGELLDAVKSSGYTVPEDVRLLVGDALFRSWNLPLPAGSRAEAGASRSGGRLLLSQWPQAGERNDPTSPARDSCRRSHRAKHISASGPPPGGRRASCSSPPICGRSCRTVPTSSAQAGHGVRPHLQEYTALVHCPSTGGRYPDARVRHSGLPCSHVRPAE